MYILKRNLKGSAKKLNFGHKYYFMQDNDRKRTAEIVKLWLQYTVKKKKKKESFNSKQSNIHSTTTI